MTHAVPPTVPAAIPSPLSSSPVPETGRIESIDALRGFALLGILVMNIQSFAMIGAAYMNPTAYGDLTGVNYWVWYLSHLFADQKFMTIFSMLFGAGVVLMTERADRLAGSSISVHYRRMGWLILFGLMHSYLLWYGDILYTYGMCGLVIYPFRRLHPALLIVLGALAIVLSGLLWIGMGLSMPYWGQAELAELHADWRPTPEQIEAELAIYRGGWLDQMPDRAIKSVFMQTLLFIMWGFWRAGGLMLVGMGLYKLGVFSARRSTGFYVAMTVLGFGIGLPIINFGVRQNFAHDWSMEYSFFLGSSYNYFSSVLVSLGWVGLVMLIAKASMLEPIVRPLAAVGRMALTNYLLHTIIATTFFYGHGFGYFGHLERWQQALFVLAVWTFQLIYSPLWLRHFLFGPAEWLWRTLTYWRIQPMRRSQAAVAVAG